MAFSHINLDAPGTPPGRNDPCPCGSGKKTRRCCGVDRCRFLPLRGRHRGVVPADLAGRVDQIAGEFTVRFLARTFLPARLGGLSPAALTDEERGELRELFWRAVRAGRPGARDPRAGRLRPTARPAASLRTRVTGSGAVSVWTGLWASSRGLWRSGCRPRRTRTVTAATTARTSTAMLSCSADAARWAPWDPRGRGRAVALAQPRRLHVRGDDRRRACAADHRPPAPGRQGHRRDPPAPFRA